MSAGGHPGSRCAPSATVAAFTYPESAARALGRAAERADWLRRPLGTVPDVDGIDHGTRRPRSWRRRSRPPRTGGSSPRGAGAPARLRDPARAGAASRRRRTRPSSPHASLGFPVVVKTAAAGAHKTETGGIALDLASEDAVRSAVERIGSPVVVQSMVSGGTELLAGLVQDPVFGPLVAFGPGGVLAELIGQASFRIAPLTDVDAEELVAAGKAGASFADSAEPRRRTSRARRPRPPAVATRTGHPGGRGARSQPGSRPSGRLCSRRRASAGRTPGGQPLAEELVAAVRVESPWARAGFYRCRRAGCCATLVPIKEVSR